jgi:2',5'-phosphodiesterase
MTATTEQAWKGRIVARILPDGVEGAFEQTRKPNNPKDPSSLCPGAGAVNHIPSPLAPRVVDKEYYPLHDSSSYLSNQESSNNSRFVRLDIYLYSEACLSSEVTTSISLQMVRDSKEAVGNCLKRLELSIQKKLKPAKKSDKKDKKNGTLSTSSVPLFGSTTTTTTHQEQQQPCNVSTMTNDQFWTKAIHDPLTINVTIGDCLSIPLYVECNPPTILGVRTYESFGALNFAGIPLVIEVDLLYATHAVVDWYTTTTDSSSNSNSITLVCKDSRCYTPTLSDAGKQLSILIRPTRPGHEGEGCQEAYQFQELVSPLLPDNTVLQLRPEWQEIRDLTNSSDLRVLTFNILADQNAFSNTNGGMPVYPYCPSEILARQRRMPLILHEILAYQADVICLQEVDELVFETLLLPVLEYFNYQGYYSVKASVGTREGCAMFWSLQRFQKTATKDFKTHPVSELLSSYMTPGSQDETSEWREPVDTVTRLFQKRPDLAKVIREKLGHVVQMARLTDHQGNHVIVANAHLFYHPMASHIRLLQCFAICHQLSIERSDNNDDLIFCGDFNTSLRHCGLLMMNKFVPENYRDFRQCLNAYKWSKQVSKEETHNDDFPAMWLPDSFPTLDAAYTEAPEFTHYVDGFHGTLDHILVSASSDGKALSGFHPVRCGAMPSQEQVTRNVAMPSENFPSDHVCLVCDLEWKQSVSAK